MQPIIQSGLIQDLPAFQSDSTTTFTTSVSDERNKTNTTPPVRVGPVFYAGRSPFRIKVMILTCFAIPENSNKQDGIYITYVGYKKETDPEFDFDEMIHSPTFEAAEKTHRKACGFFSNSKLFVESPL